MFALRWRLYSTKVSIPGNSFSATWSIYLASSFTFSPIQENTYVLSNENNECIIIDPGCYFPHEQQELKDYIDKNGFIPKRLLNTHCHLDHVFGNKFLAETWGLTLQIHEKEKQM